MKWSDDVMISAAIVAKGVAALTAAMQLAPLAKPYVDAAIKAYNRINEEKKTLIEVPEIYSSDYRLKLEDAKRWLEEDGFKVATVIAQPAIRFKDCSDLEIVYTNYKPKQKAKPGTRIILKYVTSEVIEASCRLFDESEKQKAEAKQKKAEKKAEQAIKKKQILDNAVANVQHGIGDAVTSAQKGIEGVFSNLPNKKKKKSSKDT